jgi:hypothetical protein
MHGGKPERHRKPLKAWSIFKLRLPGGEAKA